MDQEFAGIESYPKIMDSVKEKRDVQKRLGPFPIMSSDIQSSKLHFLLNNHILEIMFYIFLQSYQFHEKLFLILLFSKHSIMLG